MSTAPALVRLTSDLGAPDRARAGGKAIGLAALLRAGLTVPATWLLPAAAEPAELELRELAAVAPQWAVRSSAVVEDGAELSYAGMFSSELDVPAADLGAAISRVRASAGSDRVAAYRRQAVSRQQDAGSGHPQVLMAVLLQPFRLPVRSGVWLGRGSDAGRLEWVPGCGDALMSGTVTPHWEEWPAIGAPAGSEAELLMCDGRPVGAACRDAQRALGGPADLELAVLDSGLLWLQFRPVTVRLGPVPGGPDAGSGQRVVGTPAAGGRAAGRPLLLANAADPRWVPGGVLLVERTDPDWVPLMAQAAALVTAEGGMLCHAAIVARELGVPCVTGVGPAALRALAAEEAVAVDGTAGTVSVLASELGGPAVRC